MSKGYYGQRAVEEAARHFNFRGPVDPVAAHVIEEEGFVPSVYKDDVGVDTFGVGQTAEYLDKNFFTEVFPAKEREVKKKVPGYDGLPTEMKQAVMSAHYRGDLGPKTIKLINDGKWDEAAKEYLNHAEYKKRRAKDKNDGVVQRMERNARAMWQAARG